MPWKAPPIDLKYPQASRSALCASALSASFSVRLSFILNCCRATVRGLKSFGPILTVLLSLRVGLFFCWLFVRTRPPQYFPVIFFPTRRCHSTCYVVVRCRTSVESQLVQPAALFCPVVGPAPRGGGERLSLSKCFHTGAFMGWGGGVGARLKELGPEELDGLADDEGPPCKQVRTHAFRGIFLP